MGLSKPSVTETVVSTWLLSQQHILYISGLHPIFIWGGSLGSGHPEETAVTGWADVGTTPSCQLHPFPESYSASRDGWTGNMNINFCWFQCPDGGMQADSWGTVTSQQGTVATLPLAIKNKKAQTETESKSFESLHLDHTLCHQKLKPRLAEQFPNMHSLSSIKLPQHKPHFKLLQPVWNLTDSPSARLGTQTFNVYNTSSK